MCQRVSVSRARDRVRTVSISLGPEFGFKSNRGEPGPPPGRIRQEAPAGTRDAVPRHSRDTHPWLTFRIPVPLRLQRNWYSQPRSTAVPAGVSTKNRRGGAEILAL